MKKKTTFILMLLFAAAMMLVTTGCKWNDAGPEPYYEETREVTDENGTHTVTYTYIDRTNYHKVDPSFYKVVIIVGGVFSVMAAYSFYRANEITMLKRRCTVEVPAEITAIRKSNNWDRFIRFKYSMYNATYRYEYNGIVHESSNEYYGRKPYTFKSNLQVGDQDNIFIDPLAPDSLYDSFAKDLRGYFLFYAIFLAAAAASSFISYFVV